MSSPAASQKSGRKSASLPAETVEYLKAWMMSPEHVAHPYPTEQEKAQIMAETGIELKQLTNWFVNNRKRYWKPRVEAKLQKSHQPGAQQAAASLPRGSFVLPGGSLSISVHHMNPSKQPSSQGQGATSFPMLPSNASYAQAGPGGPASPHDHPMAAPVGPRALVGAYRDINDPHTISDGSGSSACNSDDESDSSSSNSANGKPLFGHQTPSQYLESRFASLSRTSSTASTTSLPRTATGYRRHEEVDVHVLRPEGSSSDNGSEEPLPTLRDLTIKSSVPRERILATFKCPISYTIPYEIEHDRKKVQSRRDGEVLRVKKHYLKLYLATRGVHSASSPVGSDSPYDSGMTSSASSVASMKTESTTASTQDSQSCSTENASSSTCASSTVKPTSSSRTRAFTCTDLDKDDSPSPSSPVPRKRARTSSGSLLKGEDEWRELCQNARSLHCDSLPGLEEAARMFGYVSP